MNFVRNILKISWVFQKEIEIGLIPGGFYKQELEKDFEIWLINKKDEIKREILLNGLSLQSEVTFSGMVRYRDVENKKPTVVKDVGRPLKGRIVDIRKNGKEKIYIVYYFQGSRNSSLLFEIKYNNIHSVSNPSTYFPHPAFTGKRHNDLQKIYRKNPHSKNFEISGCCISRECLIDYFQQNSISLDPKIPLKENHDFYKKLGKRN